MKDVVCKECGAHSTSSHTKKSGSLLMEFLLGILIPGLLFFFSIPIALVALCFGIAYGQWRYSSRKKSCVECGSASLVSVDTPVGKKLMAEFHPEWNPKQKSAPIRKFSFSTLFGKA